MIAYMFKAFLRILPLFCSAFLLPLSQPLFSQRVDALTVQGKVLVSYQGWFRCPGDGSPENRWGRWFYDDPEPTNADISNPATRARRVDQYPDISGMDRSSLCAVPNEKINGQQAYVFSSFPKATAETHFRWMREYNIDGALIQRFVPSIPQYMQEHDDVLRNAIGAANDNGRVIAVEYGITSADNATLFETMKADRLHLTNDLKITSSPAYLREKGKPVVSIWGIRVKDRIADPNLAKRIVEWFKTQGNATVMGGVPIDWGNFTGDGQFDPAWSQVYKELDIVQPWTPGRSRDPQSIAEWKQTYLHVDVATARSNQQEYMPVVFPGFSWHNAKRDDMPGDVMNRIPGQQGSFLWDQAMTARAAGATMVKIAMFDEVNEGTAIFKIAPNRSATPEEAKFLTLDPDGARLPSDWYLRVADEVARVYHGLAPASMPMPMQALRSRRSLSRDDQRTLAVPR
jgi:hypothetical protein